MDAKAMNPQASDDSSHSLIKATRASSAKNAASRSKRPATHTTASGLAPCQAKKAEANQELLRKSPSAPARTYTRSELPKCRSRPTQCQRFGSNPAHG